MEAPGCHLPPAHTFPRPLQLFCFHETRVFVEGDKPNTPSIREKKSQSQRNTKKRKETIFRSKLS